VNDVGQILVSRRDRWIDSEETAQVDLTLGFDFQAIERDSANRASGYRGWRWPIGSIVGRRPRGGGRTVRGVHGRRVGGFGHGKHDVAVASSIGRGVGAPRAAWPHTIASGRRREIRPGTVGSTRDKAGGLQRFIDHSNAIMADADIE
jgi:hypothetical protein